MKQILLFCSSMLIIGFALKAQPTLTATGINAGIGETFVLNSFTTQVNPGSSGTNQTWDFSSLTGTPATSIVVLPSSTPNGSYFPNANTAWSTPGVGYSYMKTSSTAWQNCGFSPELSPVILSYSDLEDMLRFPFTYNNSYTDTWATQFVSAGYTYYRTGTTTVTADGYGTIIIPGGTYTNVLRVHFLQEYQDSTYISIPYIINYTNDEYIWYKDGYHCQLAAIYTLTSSMSSTSYGGNYPTLSSDVNEIYNPISFLTVFPNPATDNITLNFILQQSGELEIIVSDITGRQTSVLHTQAAIIGENSINMDLSVLSSGIYIVNIRLQGINIANKQISIVK